MGIDSRIVSLVVLSVVLGVVLGLEAGALAGVAAAFAGLIPTVLWEMARERQARNADDLRLREAALAAFAPPVPVGEADGEDRADVAVERGAAWYLRPEAELVSFLPRPELGELLEWCVTGGHLGIRLVTGDGGAGKTRLAVQLTHELAEDGWRSLWVKQGLENEAIGAVRAIGEPVVLVLDYAETRPSLATFLENAARAGEGPEMRIVLLARSAGEWWQRLLDGTEYRISQILEAEAPITLGPIAVQGGQHEVFAEAVAAFADCMDVARPDAQLTLADPDEVVLVVHAAALLAVLDHTRKDGGSRLPQTATDVLTALLRHEARYWHRSAAARGLTLDPSVERCAVAVASLIGAASEADAARLMARIPDLADSAERRGQVARWLHDLYPGPQAVSDATEGEWIGPLRPDRVAEQHIATELSRHPGVIPGLFTSLSEYQVLRALTVLARVALTDVRGIRLLRDAMRAELEHLAVPALAVAVTTNPVAAELLNEQISAGAISVRTLARIAVTIQHPSVALAETAAIVFRRLVEGSADAADRAGFLISLGTWLRDLGQREEALNVTEEAVAIRRRLAEDRPDEILPDLALALNNQAVCLAGVGRREEALVTIGEAVGIYRLLADARPDDFLPDLAMSLNNQSSRLAGVGRWEEALMAIEQTVGIYRRLAATNVRPDAFLPELAMSLYNQSNRLGDAGRREESLTVIEEAVPILRRLAEANPDAFLPSLAESLTNKSVCLADLGRRQEALAAIEEAVTFRRRLAERHPEAFLPDLAMSLNNESAWLVGVGRPEKALAAIEEAVTIRRRLAERHPEVCLPDLAVSLNNQCACLAGVGSREKALVTAMEASQIYRDLADTRPETFLPDLAKSLNNQSACLAGVGRPKEALTVVEEAVSTYRRLAAARPEAFLPDLGSSLNNQSVWLGGLGRPDEALTAVEESVGIYRRLESAHPGAFLPDLAKSLNNLSNRLAGAGRTGEALTAIEEAVGIYRQLESAHPGAFLPDLAMTVNNLAACMDDAGQAGEALSTIDEAVSIRRRLAKDSPEAFLPGLGESLNTKAACLVRAKHVREALAVIEESVAIYRRLESAHPGAFLPGLAKSLNNLAAVLSALGRWPEADVARREANALANDPASRGSGQEMTS